PENKRGEEIPLLSRIISVVDSYDAMISVRSYKPAMTREAALEEIARCAGTQFDPAIAQCFINLMKENPALGLPGDSLSRMSVQTVFPAPPAQNDQDRGGASDVSYSRYILNSTFSIISVDDNFTVITGYSPEDVDRLHLNHMDLIPEFAKAEYLRILSEQIQRTHCALIRHLVLRKDKTLVMVYCYGRVFYDPTSREEHSEIIVSIADNSFSGEVFAGEE
ncbi:MAG: PAS domain S-box protein, partial [Lachnospiraceae bacterium]|nr:PAS domain S-box protein [Lachnospiraceae bacterium]